MAETKRPKAETKRLQKRSTAVTKRTKGSKARASMEEMPVAEAPVVDVPTVESSPEEVPTEVAPAMEASAMETPDQEAPTAEEPAPVEVSAEEIRKAAKLLRSHGYLLIPYGKVGRGIGRSFGAGVGLVGGACRGLCGWLSKKHAAMKVWREEKRRVAAEKKRLDAEAAARRAEAVKDEMRLAELRVEEARLKAIVANPKESVDAVADDSGSSKCVACGAELIPEARFCRKCGKPVAVSTLSV